MFMEHPLKIQDELNRDFPFQLLDTYGFMPINLNKIPIIWGKKGFIISLQFYLCFQILKM